MASYDKQITRYAALGWPFVLMYGRRWALEKGGVYAVDFNRKNPAKSVVVRVRPKPTA